MVEQPKSGLQITLQTAVQTVQWTYIIFWQLCPQQGILVWRDGYYNGAIKTRKTVQPTEVSTEEATLQRSQQIRELYDSLSSAAETSQQPRRPSAALSPEDLTDSEWFYLICASFSFPPGLGLPGKAYVKRQHIWLTRADEADSKQFCRAILAKSARIQTVVCLPLLDGVVELGTTEGVEEDIGLIQRIKSVFNDCRNPNPGPALSEHSTSNPPNSSNPGFHSLATLPSRAPPHPPFENSQLLMAAVEEEEAEVKSDSDSDNRVHENNVSATDHHATAHEIEPMQLDMSEDIRLGSPDDSSNNLDSDSHLLALKGQTGNSSENHGDLDGDGSMHRKPLKDPMSSSLHPPRLAGIITSFDAVAEQDTNYSLTVSNILLNQSNRLSKYSSSTAMSSAFSQWSSAALSATNPHNLLLDSSSQWALKYIVFTVPLLHTKLQRGTPHDDLISGNHMLAERRRREKLNERFVVLRSLVPFVTKTDKASVLGDTIEYLDQMRKKIQELESRVRQMEAEKNGVLKEQRSGPREKRKMRIVEGGGRGTPKVVESPAEKAVVQVEVSIIENDSLVEIQCLHKEGLLLDVMQVLGELGIKVITVQSSINNGVVAAELRAKVKENVNGRKPSIMEVKRTINRIILH